MTCSSSSSQECHAPTFGWQTFKIVSVFIVLIIFSILVAGGFLLAFLWSVKSGQYDDDYTPSVRMLFDDKPSSSPADPSTNITSTSLTQNGNNAS